MLHPNIEPHVLGPSRLTQFNDIVEKVKEAITTNQGLTIYACGLPGTGKTMIITKVVQEIQSLYPSTDIFRTAFIAGYTVDKDFLYFNLAAQLDIVSPDLPSASTSAAYYASIRDQVLTLLSKTKSRSKKPIPMKMVFIDEMDQAPYHELRTLINISSVQDSKLIIIGTGNNVSLTFELNLYTKPEIVIFKEYSKEDLMEILNARCFGKIINVHGFRFLATKILGRKSGKLLVVLDYSFCFVLLLYFVPYTYLIGDARCAIQIMCQCIEMMIQRNVDRNPDFW
jgi:Cdc6-like AAA superfamily ATPase